MWSAELAWRKTLDAKTVADLIATTETDAPGAENRVCDWYEKAE